MFEITVTAIDDTVKVMTLNRIEFEHWVTSPYFMNTLSMSVRRL